MPWVGFGLTIPASERAKTVHALDRSATVTGYSIIVLSRNSPGGTEDNHTKSPNENSRRRG
jgi:hypothetical protein